MTASTAFLSSSTEMSVPIVTLPKNRTPDFSSVRSKVLRMERIEW